MGNIAQIKGGTEELPAKLEALPSERWRLTRRIVFSNPSNVGDAMFGALGEPLELEYQTQEDETKFKNLRLIAQGDESDTVNRASAMVLTKVYETLTGVFVAEVNDVTDYEINGLKRTKRTLIAKAGTSTADFVVGTQAYGSDPVQYLAAVRIEDDDAFVRVTADYLEPGIVVAEVNQDDGGLLLVTFKTFYTKLIPTALNPSYSLTDLPNLAFQGGDAAELFKNRVDNVLGYKVYTVTSLMNSDGSALDPESDNIVHSYKTWAQYEKPGEVDVSSADGPRAYPGNTRWVKALVEEILTTESSIDDTYKPFSVTEWAYYTVSYTPADGSAPVVVSKGASGYLADSSFAGTNTTYADVEVDSVVAAASSTPTPATFYALSNAVIGANSSPAFVTDAGVKWYRKRRISVDGTFGTYLS